MVVAELVRALAVGPHGADVWPDLGLWKDHADLHAVQDMGSGTEASAGEPAAPSPEASSGPGQEQGAGTGARPVAAHTRWGPRPPESPRSCDGPNPRGVESAGGGIRGGPELGHRASGAAVGGRSGSGGRQIRG